ncbi:MAG: DUF1998 domain-containing protein, partial [Chloroflexi bacterium]
FPLDYPPHVLETTGYWLEVTPAAQEVLMQADQWRDSPNDYGPNWQEQRAKVRARDGYACTQCGTPEPEGRQHDVHHLTPFRTYGYIPGHNENYQLANRLSNLKLLCQRCHRRIEAGVRTRSGLDGLGYALGNLASLYLMCDRNDLGMAVVREEQLNAEAQRRKGAGEDSLNAEAQRRRDAEGEQHNAKMQRGKDAEGGWGGDDERRTTSDDLRNSQLAIRSSPRIYIFERIAAGLGFSQQLFERHAEMLAGAEEMIRGCGCRFGCPACVGPVLLNDGGDRPLLETKALALALLEVLRTGGVAKAHARPSGEVIFQRK